MILIQIDTSKSSGFVDIVFALQSLEMILDVYTESFPWKLLNSIFMFYCLLFVN